MTGGNGCRPDRASNRTASSATRLASSGATRSVLLIATTARCKPSKPAMSTCSTVCGLMPSLAATTSSTASIPVAPEIIVRTKRSWPGMSIRSMSVSDAIRQMRKTERDGNAALLFLGKPVGVLAGQRANQAVLP